MGGPDMGGLIWYVTCNGGPGVVRNVPKPAPCFCTLKYRCYIGVLQSHTRLCLQSRVNAE